MTDPTAYTIHDNNDDDDDTTTPTVVDHPTPHTAVMAAAKPTKTKTTPAAATDKYKPFRWQ